MTALAVVVCSFLVAFLGDALVRHRWFTSVRKANEEVDHWIGILNKVEDQMIALLQSLGATKKEIERAQRNDTLFLLLESKMKALRSEAKRGWKVGYDAAMEENAAAHKQDISAMRQRLQAYERHAGPAVQQVVAAEMKQRGAATKRTTQQVAVPEEPEWFAGSFRP